VPVAGKHVNELVMYVITGTDKGSGIGSKPAQFHIEYKNDFLVARIAVYFHTCLLTL